MDDGTCVYFGPWCDTAAILLSKYLPAQHLLAAAGGPARRGGLRGWVGCGWVSD